VKEVPCEYVIGKLRRIYGCAQEEKMRAAIYTRTACEAKEEIQSQLENSRSYAAEHGMEAVDEFIDDGCSGLRLVRPGLQRLHKSAAQGRFDVLLTSGPDRLVRQPELLIAILEELKGFGIKIVFVDGIVVEDLLPDFGRIDSSETCVNTRRHQHAGSSFDMFDSSYRLHQSSARTR
jgi:predicted site-specific integrase-resolvase